MYGAHSREGCVQFRSNRSVTFDRLPFECNLGTAIVYHINCNSGFCKSSSATQRTDTFYVAIVAGVNGVLRPYGKIEFKNRLFKQRMREEFNGRRAICSTLAGVTYLSVLRGIRVSVKLRV